MKLPRDLSSNQLVKALAMLGYEVAHQSGSHIRLTTQRNGEHHVTIPAHKPLKIGTLNAILRDVAAYASLNREQLVTGNIILIGATADLDVVLRKNTRSHLTFVSDGERSLAT